MFCGYAKVSESLNVINLFIWELGLNESLVKIRLSRLETNSTFTYLRNRM